MPNIFFGKPKGDVMEFDEHEAEHLRVVKVEEGEKVDVTDGNGIVYKVILRKVAKKKAVGDIIEAHRVESLPQRLLTLYIGSSSWERLRILIEKAVELGADRIVIYKGEKSKRDYTKKRKKIEYVVRDAAKQCKRTLFPMIKFYQSAKAIIDHNLDDTFLFFDPSGLPLKGVIKNLKGNIGIIVGPEGGFSDKEKEILKKYAYTVSLGKRILRFETAGIAALSIISYELGRI